MVVHEVFDNSTVSSPVGYSSEQSGGSSAIRVDLNASEAQNDGLDAITENVTLQAMLHETSDSSAYASAITISGSQVADNATITVTQNPFTNPIGGSNAVPGDRDDDGLYDDVDGDGTANFDDAVALAFVNFNDLNQDQINALDFDGDGDVDFDDAVELAFQV